MLQITSLGKWTTRQQLLHVTLILEDGIHQGNAKIMAKKMNGK